MNFKESNGEGAFIHEDEVCTFEITNKTRQEVEFQVSQNRISGDWEDNALSIGRFKVLPNGSNNDLPREIRQALRTNHLAPRVFTKRLFLTWGQGPFLYQYALDEEGNLKKRFVEDEEVLSWLTKNNYRKQLKKAIIDFNHGESVVHKLYRNKGVRIGSRPLVAKIEQVPADRFRCGYPLELDDRFKEVDPTHALIGKWNKHLHSDYQVYPLVDHTNLLENAVGVLHSYLDAYATRHYPHPDVVSALPWIRRSSSIPFILETLTKNNLTIRWHIKVPQAYWDAQREYLMNRVKLEGKQWSEKIFTDFKKNKFLSVTKVLSGAENTGKFIITESVMEIVDGRAPLKFEWEFTPIDQKIKDFVDANLAISKRADFNTISGLGLHAALSNVSAEGKADSGSEQLYALRNYILTEVDLPEEIICEAWNLAIEQNWPGKKIRLGFYRQLPVREQDVTPKDRINA